MLCSVLINIDQQKKVMKKYLKKMYSQIKFDYFLYPFKTISKNGFEPLRSRGGGGGGLSGP